MSGRPQRGPRAATKVLRVRLTDAEWVALEKRAARLDASMSAYVRSLIASDVADFGDWKRD